MRLIDADRLLSERMKSKYYHLLNGGTAIPIIDIEHAPTIEKRKTGKWLELKDGQTCWCVVTDNGQMTLPTKTCSECGKPVALVMWENYCPACGAKMEV